MGSYCSSANTQGTAAVQPEFFHPWVCLDCARGSLSMQGHLHSHAQAKSPGTDIAAQPSDLSANDAGEAAVPQSCASLHAQSPYLLTIPFKIFKAVGAVWSALCSNDLLCQGSFKLDQACWTASISCTDQALPLLAGRLQGQLHWTWCISADFHLQCV